MPKTQMNCPQCRQPIVAEVNQLIDVAQNPQLKQLFLAGAANIAECPHCGYQGGLSTPLVYHDPDKELLLTYFPTEMAMTRDEQEKIIGPLIKRVVDDLPQEKRKGYLFSPKTMLTLKGMVETVLEADGITKEMIQEQEERVSLIQNLLEAPEESRVEMIQQADEKITEDFFAIFSRIADSAAAQGGEEALQEMSGLQTLLLEHSTYGRKIQADFKEVEAAAKSLQDLGENLTQEKLVELVIEAPTDARLRALTRMVRQGMDYQFFTLLSAQIEQASEKDKPRLAALREKLLRFVQELDQELESRIQVAAQNLESLLKVDDIEAAVQQNIRAIDDIFVQAATLALENARKDGDLERSGKIQRVIAAIEAAQAPPPEFELIDELLHLVEDEDAFQAALKSHADEITPELNQTLTGLVTQLSANLDQLSGELKDEQAEILNKLQIIHGAVLQVIMRRNLKN